MGVFLGNGDQDNYVRMVVDGGGSIQVVAERNGVVQTGPSGAVSIPGLEAIDFYLMLDPADATVQARYAVTRGGEREDSVTLGEPISVPRTWWEGQGLAVGLISTSAGPAAPFPATWDFIEVVRSEAPSPSPPPPTYRINAGGPEVVEGSGSWEADTTSAPSPFVNASATGNTTYTVGQAIDMSHPSIPAGTPASIFQTERWDRPSGAEMQWDFAVPAGEVYEVRLYFAEIYSGAQSDGARSFDVVIDGQTVLDDYDVFAEVGGYAGVVKTFRVTSDGNLDIDFGHEVQNPAIKAIDVFPTSSR